MVGLVPSNSASVTVTDPCSHPMGEGPQLFFAETSNSLFSALAYLLPYPQHLQQSYEDLCVN